MADTYETPPHGWTCFHCGETFKQERQARWHFGATATARPGCMLRVDPFEERGFLKLFRREEERAAALEAENEALRGIVEELDDALGEDEDGDEYPDDTPMTVKYGRTTIYALKLGLLRRARALLQGGLDAG